MGFRVKLQWRTTTLVDQLGGFKHLGQQQGAAPTRTVRLGTRLREVRELKKFSISYVAGKAQISTAYLQKLEVDLVRQPSPRVLHSLSGVLEIDYAELMRLAGYVVPNEASARRRRNELMHAASSEKLTEDEAEALAEYLNWYRSRKRAAK